MLPLLVVAMLSQTPDGGVPPDRVRAVDLALGKVLTPRPDKASAIAEVERALQGATPAERPLLERTIALIREDAPLAKLVPSYVDILRTSSANPQLDAQAARRLGSGWLALPTLAQQAGLDPKPYAKEATDAVSGLVARFPKEGGMYGLEATSLTMNKAPPTQVLAAYKRCVELDPSEAWCRSNHQQLASELGRPVCTGAQLKRPLTVTGATEWKSGPALETKAGKLSLEASPLLANPDYAQVAVTDTGELSLILTPQATTRFAAATAKRMGTFVVVRLGDELLMAPRLESAIPSGKLLIAPGALPAFQLDALCSSVQRTDLPGELKL